jgi:hypothetical protein
VIVNVAARLLNDIVLNIYARVFDRFEILLSANCWEMIIEILRSDSQHDLKNTPSDSRE